MSVVVVYWLMVIGAAAWFGLLSYWLWKTFHKTESNTQRIDRLEISVEDLWGILHGPDD